MGFEDFAEVQEALWEARSKWHNIGIQLKLKVHELECINAEQCSLDDKFSEMIKIRLRKVEPCTWRDFCDALNHPTVGMPNVAEKLKGNLTTGKLWTLLIVKE